MCLQSETNLVNLSLRFFNQRRKHMTNLANANERQQNKVVLDETAAIALAKNRTTGLSIRLSNT